MLTRYASYKELPVRKNASATIVEGEGERLLRPRLRRIPGCRRIHGPTKTVCFSIVQTRIYEAVKEEVIDDDKFGASIPPPRRVPDSAEKTRTVSLDDEDGGLEALCNSGSFGGW